MDIYQSIYQSEELNHMGAAMVEVQRILRPALKDAENPHLRNKYADLASVWEAGRPACAAAGIAVLQFPVGGDGSVGVHTRLLHTSGQYVGGTVSLPLSDQKGLNIAQVAGSVISYLRRYGLAAALGIVADEDDDAAAVPARHAPARVTRHDKAVPEAPPPHQANDTGPEVMKLQIALRTKLGIRDRDNALRWVSWAVGHPVDSTKNLTFEELKIAHGRAERGEVPGTEAA